MVETHTVVITLLLPIVNLDRPVAMHSGSEVNVMCWARLLRGVRLQVLVQYH